MFVIQVCTGGIPGEPELYVDEGAARVRWNEEVARLIEYEGELDPDCIEQDGGTWDDDEHEPCQVAYTDDDEVRVFCVPVIGATGEVAAICEGGLLRAVYIDGKETPVSTFDFDTLDGGTREEIEELAARVAAATDGPLHGSDLSRDLATWVGSVHSALEEEAPDGQSHPSA